MAYQLSGSSKKVIKTILKKLNSSRLIITDLTDSEIIRAQRHLINVAEEYKILAEKYGIS